MNGVVDDRLLPRILEEQDRIARALEETSARRVREAARLSTSSDAVDRTVARMYLDLVEQARAVERTGESLLLATVGTDGPLVGRLAVMDEEREVLLTPWYAPAGRTVLADPGRILITGSGRRGVRLHRLGADPAELVEIVRARMRAGAADERMSDPLATLTPDQAVVLSSLDVPGSVILDGPPGSGKSAILLVELARRVLSAPRGESPEVLLVTGSPSLARRARALAELLGVASIRPVLHEDLLRVLRVSDEDMDPVGPDSFDTSGLLAAMQARLVDASELLLAPDRVPHPLGWRDPEDVPAVVRARATAASTSYQRSAADLQVALRSDYAAIVGPERAEPFVAGVLERLRPILKPDDLVRTAVGRGAALQRPLRVIAREVARLLLEASPARRPTWDLVVVDEYQRVPPAALGLLGLRSRRMLLSGDPRQGFGSAPQVIDATRDEPRRVHLEVSLRLPSAIATWIDDFWAQRDLSQPRIRTVARGGEVSVHRTLEAARVAVGADAQVIALEAGGGAPGSRTPFEALGLEWRSVIVVEPDAILSRIGEPGLFVAATRAIDRLAVVQGGPA